MPASLSERDICTKYITPTMGDASLDLPKQIHEEVSFTATNYGLLLTISL